MSVFSLSYVGFWLSNVGFPLTLVLDDMGNIVGPDLAPNSAPPEKVYHPKAGIGIVEKELSTTSDGDTFISYFFPNDPKTYIVTQGPNREWEWNQFTMFSWGNN